MAGAAQGLRWDTGVMCQSHLSHTEGVTELTAHRHSLSCSMTTPAHGRELSQSRVGWAGELEITPVPNSARAEIYTKMLFKQHYLFCYHMPIFTLNPS